MKNTNVIILLLLTLPFLGISQTFSDRVVNNNSWNGAFVKHVQKTQEGERAFISFNQPATIERKGIALSGAKSQKITASLLYVYDFVDGKVVNENYHLINHKSIPTGDKFTVEYKAGKEKIVIQPNEILGYKGLIQQYPELAELKYINRYNREFPSSQTESKLKTSWTNKIKGFESSRFELKSTEQLTEEKPKKGLIKKLVANSLNAQGSKFAKVESIDLDWDKTYNGGQDKKNHWINLAQASCYHTGNVLALNGRKKKDVKANEDREFESVVFNYKGEVVKRTEIVNESFWTKQKYDSYSFRNSENQFELQSLGVAFKPNTGKKVNKEGNKAQIKVINLDQDGEVVYDYIYDLKGKFRDIDTVLVYADNMTLVKGHCKGATFLTVSTPEKQTLVNLPDGFFVTKKFIRHKDMIYLISEQFIEEKGYQVLPIKNGEVLPKFEINYNWEKRDNQSFEILVNDEDRLLAVTKELVQAKKGVKKVVPTFYEITESGATALNNFEEDNKIMTNASMKYYDAVYRLNDSYYIMTQNYIPNSKKKGRFLIQNRLTEIAF